ncbi:MAG: DUF2842 domain-containing protein [Paracoccaceae bacterium]
MALSYKSRRRWSLVILVVGLPIYILVASLVGTWLAPTNILLQLLVYIVLGVIWILPFKPVFTGIGKPDPADTPAEDEKREEQ